MTSHFPHLILRKLHNKDPPKENISFPAQELCQYDFLLAVLNPKYDNPTTHFNVLPISQMKLQ